MKCLGDLEKNSTGKYTFSVAPYSTVTVTSLDVSESEEHTQGLPVEGGREQYLTQMPPAAAKIPQTDIYMRITLNMREKQFQY